MYTFATIYFKYGHIMMFVYVLLIVYSFFRVKNPINYEKQFAFVLISLWFLAYQSILLIHALKVCYIFNMYTLWFRTILGWFDLKYLMFLIYIADFLVNVLIVLSLFTFMLILNLYRQSFLLKTKEYDILKYPFIEENLHEALYNVVFLNFIVYFNIIIYTLGFVTHR